MHTQRSPTDQQLLSPTMTPDSKAAALIEALPYFQNFRGQTFLIKMGGSAMENPMLVEAVMRDIVFLEVVGINPVIVHGGGKAISAAIEQAGLTHEFINGLRRTTEATISIVAETLNTKVNPSLVQMLQDSKGQAEGLPGQTVFIAEKNMPLDEDGAPIDLGYVGQVTACNTSRIEELISQEIVPVISPIGAHAEGDDLYNINADLAAAALAKELKPAKLIYLSDVPGLMRDPNEPETLIHSINKQQANMLIDEGIIKGGMLPKVKSALDALDSGVQKIHFIDGRNAHSLLLEIFTDTGIGTEVVK